MRRVKINLMIVNALTWAVTIITGSLLAGNNKYNFEVAAI